ncbi:hypothetical protein COJ48_06305 [Bacillus cereus]|nr:hypothetical protein COJ48_06305 [Bacillus cereus]PGP76731.1 hypothetical protein CN997_24015 [Bacillus cereus]
MNVIHFEQARKRKMNELQVTTKIPIVERIYKVDREVNFDVSGVKDVPKALLEKESLLIRYK